MSALGPYVLVVIVTLAVLAIGCLAALASAAGGDVPCDGWVVDGDLVDQLDSDLRGVFPSPCPGRKPCPLHDREAHTHH